MDVWRDDSVSTGKKKLRKIDVAIKTGFGRFSWKIATDRSVTVKCLWKKK